MCLLFALWFASGIIMMYVEYPELTEQERLDNLPPLAYSDVRLSPVEAAKSIHEESVFRRVKLTTVLGRPNYQFTSPESRNFYVFADNGDLLNTVSEEDALLAAEQSGFNKNNLSPDHDGLIELDQWTLTASLNPHRPLHRIQLGDGEGSVLYVSSSSGQVVRDTNRIERFWNWLGSTIHWIYPAILRQNSALWVDVIIYLSLIGIASVVTGAIIGFMRIRIRKPYRGKDYSPYSGWMKWHHILGLLTLVFVSTFIFSGLMSMGPWGIFNSNVSPREQLIRYSGDATLRLSDLPSPELALQTDPIKEIQWHQIHSDPHYSLISSATNKIAVSNTDGDPKWLSRKIEAAIPSLIPDASLVALEIISEPDDYYYSRHNRHRPFPVYRAKFDDINDSWFHIDAMNGEVLNRVDNASRRERWLYNSLHSLDFQFLVKHRPLWDIVVMSLSLIGLGFSVTSVVVGWRKLTG